MTMKSYGKSPSMIARCKILKGFFTRVGLGLYFHIKTQLYGKIIRILYRSANPTCAAKPRD